MRNLFRPALALIALVSMASLFTGGVYATPKPNLTVTDEACGSVDLLFSNPTDEVVQFELQVNDEPAGVFTLAADTTEEWTETFEEDTGDHVVSYRVLPDGDFIDVAEVESDCLPENDFANVTILKNADGAGNLDFDFEGDFGTFNLSNDESITFTTETGGTFLIDEVGADGWVLVEIACVGGSTSDRDIDDGDVLVTVAPGESITCVFVNEAVEEPTPVPTVPATATATATAPPAATPQVIIIPGPSTLIEREYVEIVEEVVPVEVPVIIERPSTSTPVITPPNTGTGGLVTGWGWDTGDWCKWWGRTYRCSF